MPNPATATTRATTTASSARPRRPGRRSRRGREEKGGSAVTSSAGRRRVCLGVAFCSLRGHYPVQVPGVDEVRLVLSAGVQLPLPAPRGERRGIRFAGPRRLWGRRVCPCPVLVHVGPDGEAPVRNGAREARI